MVWRASEAQQGAEEERVTGFLVHAVRLEEIMAWYARERCSRGPRAVCRSLACP